MINNNINLFQIVFESSDYKGDGRQLIYVKSEEDGKVLLKKVADKYIDTLKNNPEIKDYSVLYKKLEKCEFISILYHYKKINLASFESVFTLSQFVFHINIYEKEDDIDKAFVWHSEEFEKNGIEVLNWD